MRRLFFPFEFVIALVAAEFALEEAYHFISRVAQQNMDIYVVQQSFLTRFLPCALIGIVVGYIFTSLDFVFNSRTDPTARTTQSRLLKYGARNGLVAVVFCLFWNFAVMLPLFNHERHRRYHAYGPQMDWLNIAYPTQLVVLGSLALWTLLASLDHRKNKKL